MICPPGKSIFYINETERKLVSGQTCCQENRTAVVFVEDTLRSFRFRPGPQLLWEASFENREVAAAEGVLADGICKGKCAEKRVILLKLKAEAS